MRNWHYSWMVTNKYEWLQINIDIYVLCLEGSLEYHVVYQYTVFTVYFPCKNRVFSILQKQNRSPGRLTRMSRGSWKPPLFQDPSRPESRPALSWNVVICHQIPQIMQILHPCCVCSTINLIILWTNSRKIIQKENRSLLRLHYMYLIL